MSVKIDQIESKKSVKAGKLYDKSLIKQIVKEIESGLPRQDAIIKYRLHKRTLDDWMLKFGSDEYHNTKRRIYSNTIKRQVVAAIKNKQMDYREAMIAFNIKNIKSIRNWVNLSCEENADICILKNDRMAKEPNKNQEPTLEDIKSALKLAELKLEALNTLIDIAEDQYKINIRKKSGAKQSPN
jgi:transposase